jgi:hypothetical protein
MGCTACPPLLDAPLFPVTLSVEVIGWSAIVSVSTKELGIRCNQKTLAPPLRRGASPGNNQNKKDKSAAAAKQLHPTAVRALI